ncbi:hypothetical protein D3C87_1273310 [compost metagenome]
MYPRDHDNKPIAGVGRLADQARVVGGLSRLDVADHHSTAVPRSFPLGIFKQAEDAIGHVVQRCENLAGKSLLGQELTVALPIVGGDPGSGRIQPRFIASLCKIGPDRHGDAVTLLELQS